MQKYNSSRELLVLREYGRNVQNLVKQLNATEDKAARTKQAKVLLKIMATLDASRKSHTESSQKRWHDLLAMSGYELDIDTPYPIAKRLLVEKAPEHLGYNQNHVKFRNYGRNIERLIQQTLNTTDTVLQEKMTLSIIRLMRQLGSNGNSDKVDCDTVLAHLQRLSNGKLTIDRKKVMATNIFHVNGKDRGKNNRNSHKQKK